MDIEKLKQKILDLAIRGKLVPQDPNDEPASVLIEKIKNEKNELIKQGKIKPTKDDSYIYRGSDNCYYENNAKIDFKTKLDFSSDIIWMKGKDFIYPMESKRPTGNEFKYIDIDAINNKTQMIDTPKIVLTSQAPSRASRKVYSTSTLFSMVRPYLRNIAYVGESYKDCIASTGFYVCTPMPFVNPKYLYLLLTSDFIVDSLNYFMKGDNSPSINGTNIENLYFPILPLAKQIETVNLVEKILQKIEFIRVNNENLLNLLDSAKKVVLDEYFGENSSYKSYYQHEVTELQNICTKITKGSTPTTYGFNFLNRGISFIKVENVKNYRIDNKSINCFISNEANEFQKRSQLKENDILFSIAGTIGKTCIVTKENLPANTNQAFAILSEYKKITPKYLLFFIEYSKLLVDSHGAGMLNATLTGIKKINIWYPVEKNIQEEMTNKIESSFKLLDSIIS